MSKRLLKLARALHQKKHRQDENAFLVEGEKSVVELLKANRFPVRALLYTEKFYARNSILCESVQDRSLVTESELTAASTFETNGDVIAIAEMKNFERGGTKRALKGLVLVLDQIKDPGNLGTIIRLADWYGIKQIICSPDCVDFYNSKTIAASMGSFLRTEVIYAPLHEVLSEKNESFGAFLGGENIHSTRLPNDAFIVIGNESNGIRPETEKFIKRKITIPRFGEAESLNAATATAIILDNFKRQNP